MGVAVGVGVHVGLGVGVPVGQGVGVPLGPGVGVPIGVGVGVAFGSEPYLGELSEKPEIAHTLDTAINNAIPMIKDLCFNIIFPLF